MRLLLLATAQPNAKDDLMGSREEKKKKTGEGSKAAEPESTNPITLLQNIQTCCVTLAKLFLERLRKKKTLFQLIKKNYL